MPYQQLNESSRESKSFLCFQLLLSDGFRFPDKGPLMIEGDHCIRL